MPAARGVKRTASKSSAASASTGPKNKKKRGAIQLEVPSAPKRRGRVLTCGQGDVGQLGLGEDVVETSKFKHVAALGDKIVDTCAGGMHTVALDSDGKVWTFGCNDEGALGRPTSNEKDEGTPRTVPLPQGSVAVAVAAGDSHSAALLSNGDVYAWGAFRDSVGSMGLVVRGREGKACREPVKVDIGEQAVAIASGGDHLVILSTSGAVYTMGCGEQGQLGRLSQRSASRNARQGFSALLVPSKVTLKASVSSVWAGYHATFALDATAGKLFAWGLNNYGQLGITGEKRKTALFSPTECDAFSGGGSVAASGASWTRVAPGQHHSLALDSNGQVYAIGRCEYGRLGLGDRAGDAEALEPVPALQDKRCISIAAGTSNSFAVTATGEVLSWGMGSEGQLGTGTSADASEPTPAVLVALGNRKPIHVSAGGQHSVVLVEDPSAAKDPSPAPEKEPAEEKVESEETEEEPEPEPEKEVEKERGRKRGRKHEQDEEISSTSSQPPARTEEKPQKLNGKDKVDAPMEVDETDKAQDKDDGDTKTDEHSSKDTETENTESEKEDTIDTKPDTMDTSSQDTSESDTKPDSEGKRDNNDVDMEKEVNGTPDTKIVESKAVETLIPTDNALTTSA